MLTQIFSNLLGNALKFVSPGTKPQIQVWSETSDKKARIFVKDNGIGIPASYHHRIFSIFEQVEKSPSGTGIGLAIVKKAIDRMGGAVGVQSEPGQGSTFWIEIQRVP